MSLLAPLRRVAERHVRGDDGQSASGDVFGEVVTELPGILAIVGAAAALLMWRRSKHRD